MSDLFLGIADPEFWRNCGYALLGVGLIGAVAVILLLDRKRGLQKGLALPFIAVVLAGLGVARFGNNALLSEARERAREAELELAKLKTPRTLTPEAQRSVASALQKFAGQEFEGQVAPGSEDARPLWEELDKALRAANWVRVAPSGLAVGDPPAGIPLSPQLRRDRIRRGEPGERARADRARLGRGADGGRSHRRRDRLRRPAHGATAQRHRDRNRPQAVVSFRRVRGPLV